MRMRPHAVLKLRSLRTRAYERLWPDGSSRPTPKGTLACNLNYIAKGAGKEHQHYYLSVKLWDDLLDIFVTL